MTSAALLLPLIVTLAGHASASPPPVSRPCGFWLHPLPTAVMAADEVLTVSGGSLFELADWQLVVRGTYTRGNWYGCSTRSEGAWISGGFSIPLGHHRDSGFFLEPRLQYRWFQTGEGATGLFGCGSQIVEDLPGTDWELGAVATVGYLFQTRWLYLGLAAGLGVGWCERCPGGGPLFGGNLALGERDLRRSRPTLLLDVNLLRLGIRF
ncbi:MAG: hypothetical protein P1V51_17560 [Deltaproteobacteria bacterium]|nr:hypothetical protein [Deltaproteobacteria bacterium]